jgi:hypothetical protein
MKKNVLVFPCGSEIGLEIHKSLNLSTHFELYGVSSIDDHGMFVYKNYIGGLPYVDAPDFVDKLNQVVAEKRIDFIIPTHDSVVLMLAQAAADGRLNCTVVTSPVNTCEIARFKSKTYEFLGAAVATPKVYGSREDVIESDLPIFLKPDVGQGSKGTHLVKSLPELDFYLSGNTSLIILEYLPGAEYTVECFTNKDGQLLFCEGRQRNRVLNGISVNTETIKDGRFAEIGGKINQALEFRGAWFFQLKEREDGELVLMEIAPRIAGTMSLVRSKGVNLVLLSLFDAMGYDVEVFENSYSIVVDRALGETYKHDIKYRHVYLDFDDLVIFEGKVNPAVMAFVYQCMNKDVKVHLLTRHRQDLEASLNKYKLNGIFDELIWIQDHEEKFDYIKENDAIFIDDSFAERKKVHKKLGIPVFDAHMIESLMEKF